MTGRKWSDHQLASISLQQCAHDFQVGQGQMTIPGDHGWIAGDRITIIEETGGGENLLYMGFVAPQRQRQRNPASPLEMEIAYSLMDANRQGIGRNVIDWVRMGDPADTDTARVTSFASAFLSDLSLTVDNNGLGTQMEAKTYTSDGITDLVADLVLYTGLTAFMVPGTTDNTYILRYRDLTDTTGLVSGLTISDVAANVDNVTVFAPQMPVATYGSADLKNVLVGRNGITTVSGGGTNGHNTGGLHWEASPNYGSNENSLVLYVNSQLATNSDEIASYACTIGPLTGAQARQLMPGMFVTCVSDVFANGGTALRISTCTFKVAAYQGVVAPGLWDAALELSYPRRLPTAALGYGGQGGQAGSLAPLEDIVDHIGVTQSDLAIPVGGTASVELFLATVNNKKVPIDGVTINTLIETVPAGGTDYTLTPASDVTDTTGTITATMTHVSAGPSTKVRATGYL